MPPRQVMRLPMSRIVPALVALVLAGPASLWAQAPAVRPEVEALAGSWRGWAKLSNDWPGLECSYEGAPESEAVRLELASEGGLVRGSVAIDLPAAAGSACPVLRKRYTIAEVSAGTGTVAFTDSGGNEWTLSLRRDGSVLVGLLAWRAGGPEQPLAEGAQTKTGVRPMTRLAGEVRLRKAAVDGAPAATASSEVTGAGGAGARSRTGAGRHLGNLGLVIGANAVGLAAVYGVNKLGQGASTEGAVTCSPRVCVIGAPNAPCLCYNEIVVGASCGETKTGLAEGETGCDGAARPCASNLSCNSGVCQDESGRCPF